MKTLPPYEGALSYYWRLWGDEVTESSTAGLLLSKIRSARGGTSGTLLIRCT